MSIENFKICCLSGNVLKIIAAISMLIDHVGYMLFPEYKILRIIGRISFPIFAFMIAEGCNYTKNKLRYFIVILSLATVYQIVYFIYDKSIDMGIFVTFSLSILIIYSFQNFKQNLFSINASFLEKGYAAIVFLLTVSIVWCLNISFNIDYGFLGCIAPMFASLFRSTNKDEPIELKRLDNLNVHVFTYSIGLLIMTVVYGGIQSWSLLAIPFLLLYSGKRGEKNMKTFFYLFYPLHFIVLEVICTLI